MASSRSAFGITERGELYTSGANECGQLGLSNFISVTTFNRVYLDLKIKQISCGWCHSMILTEEGQVFVTGNGKRGQLGLGVDFKAHDLKATDSLNCFTLLEGIKEKVIRIACGLWSSFAVLESGKVMFWGQFRTLETEETFSPIFIDTMHNVSKISVGHKHILTLSKCGKVSGFGCNKYGQIEISDLSDEMVIDIFTGWNHSIIQLKSGKLILIGKNDKNQLANTDSNCKKNILNYGNVQLAVGSDHALLLSSESEKLFVWGWNEHGTLGQNHHNQTFGPPQLIDFDFKSTVIKKIICGPASCFIITK